MKWSLPLTLFAAALTLGGCRNECQEICHEMSDLYDDCGRSYTQSDLLACYEAYEDPEAAELKSCADAQGQLEEILAEQSETGDACEAIEEEAASAKITLGW